MIFAAFFANLMGTEFFVPLLRRIAPSKSIIACMGVTGVVGYEVFNRNEPLLPNGAIIQNKDSFIYGGGLRLSLETYLGDHLVMLVQGRTKVVWGTSVERFRPSAGVGLRYIF